MSRLIDLREFPPFGRWTVLERGPNGPGGHTQWLCQCMCGTVKLINASHLRRGKSLSCRCIQKEGNWLHTQTHGMSQSPEFQAWCNAKSRCFNPKNSHYVYYGGRGITMCQEWQDSFESFYASMGPRPSPQHSLDRFPDTNGNYEPANCRWATSHEQTRNMTRNRMIMINGRKECLMDWLHIVRLGHSTFLSRKHRGLSDEEALMTPLVHRRRPTSSLVPADISMMRTLAQQGFTYSLLTQIFHVSLATVSRIIHCHTHKHA